MKIHHLNCGTLVPLMTHWVHGVGSFKARPPLVTHCLLVDTGEGLLLVDTGFGRGDYQHPTLMVAMYMLVSNYDHSFLDGVCGETAYQQVQNLGYQPEDVRHIAITHMHLDHIGGLPDFPKAKIHIYAREYEGIIQPRTLEEKYICRREHWSHNPDWVVHEMTGDNWFGIPCTPLVQFSDIAFTFVPFPGHTRGNSAVALRTPQGWLVHCGDTYVYHGDVHPEKPYYPPKYRTTLKIMGLFSHAFRELGAHSSQLRKLLQEHGDEIQIFCSHDPLELSRFSPEFNFNTTYHPSGLPGTG